MPDHLQTQAWGSRSEPHPEFNAYKTNGLQTLAANLVSAGNHVAVVTSFSATHRELLP